MPNPKHLKILKEGVAGWNAWREKNLGEQPDLSGANLNSADLTRANLVDADLHGAQLWDTVFSDTTLSGAKGLDACAHRGPSTIDVRTLQKSGRLPEVFLRGCGLPEE